jgi:hypothetical protein
VPIPFLSQMNLTHILPSWFLKIHFNIISHIWLDLSSSLFPLDLPIKTLYVFLYSLSHANMPHQSKAPSPNLITYGKSTNHKVFIMQFSPASCRSLHLTSKYYPQYPILEHLHTTLPPQHEKPSFRPTNNSQNYSSWHFYVYAFWKRTATLRWDIPVVLEHKCNINGSQNATKFYLLFCYTN